MLPLGTIGTNQQFVSELVPGSQSVNSSDMSCIKRFNVVSHRRNVLVYEHFSGSQRDIIVKHVMDHDNMGKCKKVKTQTRKCLC